MLNPNLQHCQTKLPCVTPVNIYLPNHPLSGCEDVSLVPCVTWKSACPKNWWKPMLQKMFQQSSGNCPVLWWKRVPFCSSSSLERAQSVGVWAEMHEVVEVNLWVALTTLETPVCLFAGRHLKPGCGFHAIADIRPPSDVLKFAWHVVGWQSCRWIQAWLAKMTLQVLKTVECLI